MILRNTPATYGLVAQCLHWLVAALIALLLALGFWMTRLPLGDEAEVQRVVFFYSLHKTIGIATFVFVLLRLVWAAISVRPRPLNADRPLEAFAAASVHWLLYAAILLMPLSGWLHHAAHSATAPIWWPPGLSLGQELPLIPKSDSLSHLFGMVHQSLAWLILGILALHVGGALKHALIDRDGTLARMLPFVRPPAPAQAAATREGSHRAPFLAAMAVLTATLALAVALALAEGMEGGGPWQAAGPAGPGGWTVDHEESRLAIAVGLMGSRVSGRFERWDADIVFDPDATEGNRVEVRIDTASLRLGDVTEQARGPAYLDAEQFPEARFVAERFEHEGGTAWLALGRLSLRGQEAAVTLPFDLRIEGDHATMSGQVSLDRMTFGIGSEAMPGEDSLAFMVDVSVTLAARRGPPTDQAEGQADTR